MVFTLDDLSGLLGREGQRLKLLQGLATGLRAPAANLRAAVETLATFPDMEPARRAQFVEIAKEGGVKFDLSSLKSVEL